MLSKAIGRDLHPTETKNYYDIRNTKYATRLKTRGSLSSIQDAPNVRDHIKSEKKKMLMKIGSRYSSVLSSQGSCHSSLIPQVSLNRQTRKCLCLLCLLYI